jgi:cyclopropane fatty-acyl-phospholipid synthase-like methyltransferase
MDTPDNSNRRAVRAYCQKKFIERYAFKHGKAPTAEQIDKHVSDDILLARISHLRNEIAKDIWKLVYDEGLRKQDKQRIEELCDRWDIPRSRTASRYRIMVSQRNA